VVVPLGEFITRALAGMSGDHGRIAGTALSVSVPYLDLPALNDPGAQCPAISPGTDDRDVAGLL